MKTPLFDIVKQVAPYMWGFDFRGSLKVIKTDCMFLDAFFFSTTIDSKSFCTYH